jgi:hypothetical protein
MKSKFLLLFILTPLLLKSQVLINEFSCSNLSQFPDNYGKYEDWIELYNAGSTAVSLSGWYLSDDSTEATKWQIPGGVVISAGGFLRIWTSGRNEYSGGHLHAGFKLTQTKNNPEFVVLANPSGTIVDLREITVITKLGHSYGRIQNGSGSWGVFTSPSCNAGNNAATAYTAYAATPTVNQPAGFYSSPVTLSLSTTEPGASIRYTLDGSLPTASSALYTAPITINATQVLKAVTFSTNSNILPSFVLFNTYFINENHALPVVSVSGDQLMQLANGNSSLKPHGTFEYFNTAGQRKAKTYGEFNKHGQDSWVLSQRSMDFISRDEMGYNHSVEEEMYATTNRRNFQRVMLRAAGDDNYPADHNSANEGSAHLRDAYVHYLADAGKMHLDVRRFAKCVVYLDGQYWGVYDLRERPDDHDYTDYYYGQDKYNLQYLLIWGNTWAEYGGQQAMDDWDVLYNYIMTQDMSDPANFAWVASQYDYRSLVDYVIINSFCVCSDWLNWNTGWWRGLDSSGGHKKWGYILWDNDATFGHYINYTGIPNTNPDALPCDPEGLSGSSDPEGHIQILLRLRSNPVFEQYYISREIDLWNTVFSCDNMLGKLDSIAAIIDPEMTRHAARWNGTYSEWQSNVQQLRDFIDQRCVALSGGFVNCYGITGPYLLTLDTDPHGAGQIKLNSLMLNTFPWTGSYFGNMDQLVEILPAVPYNFTHWTAASSILGPSMNALSVTAALFADDTITAHFDLSSTEQMPADCMQIAAYPNPFTDKIILSFVLEKNTEISFRIIDALGQTILLQSAKKYQSGAQNVSFDMNPDIMKPGNYFLEFKTANERRIFRMIRH